MLGNKKIGFIGAGTMAKAIIYGLINSGRIKVDNITASEISDEQARKVSKEINIKVIKDNQELVKNSDIIILSIKPHNLEPVLYEVKDFITPNKLIISIAAGVSTDFIEDIVGHKINVVRAMPNTPAVINEGMTAVCKGRKVTDDNIKLVIDLFQSIGRCIEVPEKMFNAVTAINGSGPAFIYLMIEAMADGGVKLGLTKKSALELAAQTFLGAAKMVVESGTHPSVLKDDVTTPGGCTIAGLLVMEEKAVRSALIKTIVETSNSASGLGK